MYRQSRDEDHEEMCTTNALVVAAVAEAKASSGSRRWGSQPGGAQNEERFRESRRKNMMEDYFVECPVFSEEVFRTLYRMSHNVFNRISSDLCRYDQYFVQKSDAAKKVGLENTADEKRVPTIILEAVASYDTWIWHAFFGMPGSCNDLNVLAKSLLFDELTAGYYLADGIYPQGATFVKSIPRPTRPKDLKFSQAQEGYMKDVERCFGILQSRFSIVRVAARGWDREDLRYIMLTCIILHNMIIEDKRPDDSDQDLESDEEGDNNMRPRFGKD
ncbi:uncharacterized protein LOC112203230 [Rosa chinensis]|uniref:uncharacterized protein LOC112203230 n=1 Tax=Rosa chinensis TaxID=74649 RepID=UPI000D09022F|nr:uncharacterized protein LOC112203230 [Rosa chinensis]